MDFKPDSKLSADDLRSLDTYTWTIDGMVLPTDPPAGRREPLGDADARALRESLINAVEAGTHVVSVREKREDSISFFADGPGVPKGFFTVTPTKHPSE